MKEVVMEKTLDHYRMELTVLKHKINCYIAEVEKCFDKIEELDRVFVDKKESFLYTKADEKKNLENALALANNNREKAAEILHMPLRTFYRKLKNNNLTGGNNGAA